MKTLNLATTLLLCVFFINITNAQTVKKQQTNKERLTKKTSPESNIKSADFSKDDQHITISPKVKHLKQEQIGANKKSGKIKMISPTSTVPHQTKKQSYKSKYYQQRKITGNKDVKDE